MGAWPLVRGLSGPVPSDVLGLGRDYGASLDPRVKGAGLFEPWLSSHSLSLASRCTDFAMTSCSIAWITGSHESSELSCRSDHLSMFCRRACVRNQRGSSLWGITRGEPGKAFVEVVIDAPRHTNR